MTLLGEPDLLGLTPEQRAIVQADDGPVVVIAGAGTGKTRVIVERVRWLLETKGGLPPREGREVTANTFPPAAEPTPRHGDPFGGPLVPEQILVLTYNVKAAGELQDRLDGLVGPAVRARITVTNFHSFCQHVLTESAADAGLPARPDVLDGVGQLLLLRDLRPALDLRYHEGDWALGGFVQFINRAKDELVDPVDFDRFVAGERAVYERRYGSFDGVPERLETQGNLGPLRKVRTAYAGQRAGERAEEAGNERHYDPNAVSKAADREARRTVAGDGQAHYRSEFARDDHDRIDAVAAAYERDGAALEILRLGELARVYRAYEDELTGRGALDFGEQIALVARLFKTRPNVLRRWQRQYRYLLVDEFQDANVAQIELIELLGRTPDRPDNVMVVGDDDQSIYRFRGASFAAFAEFEARFAVAPAHDPGRVPPGPPRRLRIDRNFRSTRRVIEAANRLIERNTTRFEPDKHLWTERADGLPVELHVCAGAEDEAVAIVDAVRALADPSTAPEPDGRPRRWTDVAVLYRKHKHRDAIVARLREEDIPYTVVGGLSLFEAPEIRDLEQGLRAIADPHDDAALVRMMTAGPWRMDALEILRVARDARFDRSRLADAAQRMVERGEEHEDVVDEVTSEARESRRELADVPPVLRAKLRALLRAIEELNPLTWREGPYTILERYLERTGVVLDLLAAGTLEARRSVVNIASFMRFASDWQAANPARSLADFVDYLDAYKAAGGELPTSVELTEDVDGVRLMTLYQAKGLEFPIVIVPNLLEGEWPAREQGGGWFPRELLREAIPTGDIHADEERRLLYVAMTRAQERLILTTFGAGGVKAPSRFVGELRDGAGEELREVDRGAPGGAGEPGFGGPGEPPTGPTIASTEQLGLPPDESFGDEPSRTTNRPPGGPNVTQTEPLGRPADGRLVGAPGGIGEALAAARRVMPMPTARERRLAMRLQAAELVGLMEGTDAADPEAARAREALATRLAEIGRGAAMAADEARAAGLDPLTFRSIALDSGAGANLLAVAPLPAGFSYSSLSTYEACPLRYALGYVYRIPEPDRPAAPLTFGSTAHAAFEAFTRERRERIARGEAPPSREDLERHFAANWHPAAFGDRTTEEAFGRRVGRLLDNFWDGELASVGEAIAEEQAFELVIDPGDGSPAVRIYGGIDRIDRLPGGGIEVIDYKTGKISSQKGVDENLQLSIYALACRDALGLGTPERVTLYFTESATRLSTVRTDEQLDRARADILARVRPIRAGEFTANPGRACEWCAYRALCPERT